MKKKWTILNEEKIYSTSIFSLNRQECQLRNGKIMPAYYVMNFPNWIHVLPLTAQKEIIMVKQYRQGTQDWFLEFPGGSFDSKDKDPKVSGQRELLEETGYKSNQWEEIMCIYPNPAFQTNKLYIYMAFDCLKTQEPQLEPFEELELKVLSFEELECLSKEGKINHALMLSSLFLSLSKIKDYFDSL